MLISLILLFVPTGNTQKDTSCYTKQELKRIADGLVRKNECDSLLKNKQEELSYCDSMLIAKDSALSAKDSTIYAGVRIIDQQGRIIEGQSEDIEALQSEIEKYPRIIKWLKIGWASTSGTMITIIIYLVLLIT